MALIKCPECGKEISDKAKASPKCGCPIDDKEDKKEEKKESKIKLVAAKCPNCGSNIEVNRNDNKAKCEYCRSTVIVDDAIERLRIEISGEVEVKNLPKLESMLRVADRHYDNEEYDEALEQYSAAVVLDPTNPKAVLRKGICKSLTTNYAKFEIVSALNGFKEAMKLEKDEEKKKTYIMEMTLAASKLESFAFRFYNKLKYIGSDEIYELLVRLNLCSEVYENILPYVEDNTVKEVCYKGIVNDCTEILRDKYYGSGRYKNGQEIQQKYVLKSSFAQRIEAKRKKYITLLNELDPKLAKQLESKNQNYKIEGLHKLRIYLLAISFIFGYFLGVKDSRVPFLGYLLIVNGILLIKPLLLLIFRDKAIIAIAVSLLITGFCVYQIIINLFPSWASDQFISTSSNEKIIFEKKNVKICVDDSCNNYTQTYEKKDKYTIIKIEDKKYKYQTNYSTKFEKDYLFCLYEDNKCVKFYYEDGEQDKYVANAEEENLFYEK